MNGDKFCRNCGKQISEDFKLCPYCGNITNNRRENYNNYNTENKINYYSNNYEESSKNGIVCLLLLLLLGGFGAHKFYAGRIAGGVVMLVLTITIIGAIVTLILGIIDLIQLLSGNFKDSEGRYIKIRN